MIEIPYDSFYTEDGERIYIVKNRLYYRPTDIESYKQEIEQQELQWQNETYHCFGCGGDIRLRDTFWFLSSFRYDGKYARLPERVTCNVACVPCVEKRIAQFSRNCADCSASFYLPIMGGREKYCEQCRTLHTNEASRVSLQVKRARDVGLEASLTIDEWMATIAHFSRLCAYCQTSPFLEMDHFIPLHLGGGTTVRNCVPACDACNARKRGYHPDDDLMIARFAMKSADIERVRSYLATR